MELVTLLKTCWKRKWVIVAFTVILPLLTLIVCLKMTKVYEAVAKVKLVQFEDTQSLLQKEIPETWGNLDHVGGIPANSQAEVLRSRMVVAPVIDKLNLRRRVTIIDKMLKFLGLIDEYSDEPIRLDKLVEPGYIGAFLQRRQIYIEPVEDSDIITIYAYSDILEEARDIANAVAESYVVEAGRLKQEKAQEALDIIDKNLKQASARLEQAQNKLKTFQETHSVVNLDQRITNIQQNLNDLENQQVATRNDLMVRTSRLAELSEESINPSVLQATMKSTEGYPHIQDLETKLIDLQSSLSAMLVGKTAKHPEAMELQAQIDGIKRQLFLEIKRLLENEIIELKKTDEALTVSTTETREGLKRLADTKRQQEDLQREIDTDETFYLNLDASRDSAVTAAGTNYGNATIITHAELPDPSDPYYPEPPLYTILATFIGLMFGFGMAFIVEYMDLSIKTPDDIQKATDLPLLGIMPKVRTFGKPKLHAFTGTDKFAGAILEIKHNILKHADDKRVIAVNSALKKEGKTYLLGHLAIALAQEGHRVALADLNLKRPGVHKLFHLSNNTGTSEFLTQKNEDISAAVQTLNTFPKLGIFPAGNDGDEALQRLSSPGLQELIAALKNDYDYVLLDTAARESLAGGGIVAAKADATVLVLSMEGPTPLKTAETIAALQEADAEIMGVVANRVRA